MPVLDSIAEGAGDMTRWRRHLHRFPELGIDCHRTAAFVAARLRDFGVDAVHDGIGWTGVVGLIDGDGRDGPTTALRSGMDALPMDEAPGRDWASVVPGRMHASGHDGHMAMLLGAARHLAATRGFAGRAAVVFQPAQETGCGAALMLADGLMDRFGIDRIFALQGRPTLAAGRLHCCAGLLTASTDRVEVTIRPRDAAADAGACAAAVLEGLRRLADGPGVVLHLSRVHPAEGGARWLEACLRSLTPEGGCRVRAALDAICAAADPAGAVEFCVTWREDRPATINHPAAVAHMLAAAREVAGAPAVDGDTPPDLATDDFGLMLQARPGACLLLGTGGAADLHSPRYDFNDAVLPLGASVLARLVERPVSPPTPACARAGTPRRDFL